MPHKHLNRLALMLLLPTLLLAGCANQPQSWSPLPVAAPAIPELPPQARQQPTPAICSPSCSTNLSSEIGNWQKSLILPE
ncbi:hypothetical protein HK44_020760 [Pseudomonas fluorescens HK44]|uniref:Uncharacterized protein n=1 Tax=Pseudomonas fluorescens HK44 TaxID=1042209 RepID=A0A010RU72_PSEFL|nr:hypothetical protein HK44_020760 [Pseudomonas fluorescens HK44]